MKQLAILFALLLVAGNSFAAERSQTSGKTIFQANTTSLADHLNIEFYQGVEFQQIHEIFVEMQEEALTTPKKEKREQKMQKAINYNLKKMKNLLNKDQYRTYVMLLNITNNNKQVLANL